MRHFRAAGAVPRLASGMVKPAGAAVLIAPAGLLQRDPPRVARASPRAVALAAVAAPAQEEELLAVGSDADDQPQRVHTLPRSGRGGWTTSSRCANKGAANRSLPGVMPPGGPGWLDSGPPPLNAVGGNGLPQSLPQGNRLAASRSQIPRFLVIVHIVDVVDGEVALAQRNHPGAHRVLARLGFRPVDALAEEVAVHLVPEAPAEDAEGAGLVAEPEGHLGRRGALGKVGAQRLVLALAGRGGVQEEPGRARYRI